METIWMKDEATKGNEDLNEENEEQIYLDEYE